jgi:ketosteroid isomerase-like protein
MGLVCGNAVPIRAGTMLFAVSALALASGACQTPARHAAELSEVDVAAVKAVVEEHVQAGIAGDWETFFSHYAEDAVVMWPNRPAIEGLEALKDVRLFRANEYEIIAVEVDGRGDLAFVRGAFSMLLDYEGAVRNEGKLVWILRRQSDGSWLIAVNISNSDLPLPEEGSGT